MGRMKPIYQIQKELEYAQKRAAYLTRTDRPVKQTVDKRIKTLVGYASALVKIGTTNALIALQVPQDALTKFGGELSLGLVVATGTALDGSIKEPKGFKPAQVHGLVGTSTPTVAIAKTTGRRYIKYGANSAGSAQATFSCAVSSGDTTPLESEQRAKAATVAASVKTVFNADADGYGRLWFTSEVYSLTLE